MPGTCFNIYSWPSHFIFRHSWSKIRELWWSVSFQTIKAITCIWAHGLRIYSNIAVRAQVKSNTFHRKNSALCLAGRGDESQESQNHWLYASTTGERHIHFCSCGSWPSPKAQNNPWRIRQFQKQTSFHDLHCWIGQVASGLCPPAKPQIPKLCLIVFLSMTSI